MRICGLRRVATVAVVGMVACGVATLGLLAVAPPPASAAVMAATVSPTSGGASTPFFLSLPVGSGCVNSGTFALSFMVPLGTDVQNLTFLANLPTLTPDGAFLTDAPGQAWPGTSAGGGPGNHLPTPARGAVPVR
jgi:hypothetical protein